MTDYTPILHIQEVASNQNQKEATINTAVAILEAAANDTYTHSGASGDITVDQDRFTRYMLHRVTGNAVPRTMWLPDTKRVFIVSNEGSATLTVRPNGSASGSAIVGAGKIIIFATDGNSIFALSSGVSQLSNLSDVLLTSIADSQILIYVASSGKWENADLAAALGGLEFTDLSDVPANYSGAGLKVVRVNAGATGLEFANLNVPVNLGDLANVEDGTGTPTDGFYLRYRDGVWQAEPGDTGGGGGTTFLALTDTPDSYAGQGLKFVRVNVGGTALEFATINVPSRLGDLADVEDATGTPNDGDYFRYRQSVWQAEPPSPTPNDVGLFISGKPDAGERVARVLFVRTITMPDDFAGSVLLAGTAATGSSVFDVKKNGSSIGSITVSASGVTGAFATTGGSTTFTPGDYLDVIAPGSQDATLADIAITFWATRAGS